MTRLIAGLLRGESSCCISCAHPVNHGWTGSPEHAIWARARYQGRIPETWLFRDFLAEVGARPEDDGGGKWVLGRKDPKQELGPGNAAWVRRSDLMRSLGLHSNRGRCIYTTHQIKLLRYLEIGPASSSQVCVYLKGHRSVVWHRLKLLADRGLVKGHARTLRGRELYWAITPQGREVVARFERESRQVKPGQKRLKTP
jgi:DNA-binding MarR family transcriptional regulator